MTDLQEQRQTELEGKKDAGTITPAEQTVLDAINELDERTEKKADADKVLADAIAANPNPAPDPVTQAHDAVVAAATAEDTAQKAYDDAEMALTQAAPATPAA